jgi:hypothetical protein
MNVLWIPIFSMRSHETGLYSILKDGNFQLALNRALASDFEDITITIPRNHGDGAETIELIHRLSLKRRQLRGDKYAIHVKELWYGENAVDTRKRFWQQNNCTFGEIIKNFDLVITDVTGYCWSGVTPFVNNFNITKIEGLERPYIDEFFEQDVKSAKLALFTTVLNPAQKENLEAAGVPGRYVKVYQKACHESYYFENTMFFKSIIKPHEIFWPFRISDKAYRFEEFLEQFEAQGLHEYLGILITDPNDSYKLDKPYIRKIRPSKAEYYMILSQQPKVVMLDNIDLVLHPGTLEFFMFGCRTIVFRNSIVNSNYSIDSLDELSEVLDRDDQSTVDLSSFCYRYFETSGMYCEEFLQSLIESRRLYR